MGIIKFSVDMQLPTNLMELPHPQVATKDGTVEFTSLQLNKTNSGVRYWQGKLAFSHMYRTISQAHKHILNLSNAFQEHQIVSKFSTSTIFQDSMKKL